MIEQKLIEARDPVEVEIDIEMSLDDIPDASCEYCGKQMKKILIRREFGKGANVEAIVISTKEPGYFCEEGCGMEWLSHKGTLTSLVKGAKELEARGFINEARRMQKSVNHEIWSRECRELEDRGIPTKDWPKLPN